jgi:hypothetical protein
MTALDLILYIALEQAETLTQNWNLFERLNGSSTENLADLVNISLAHTIPISGATGLAACPRFDNSSSLTLTWKLTSRERANMPKLCTLRGLTISPDSGYFTQGRLTAR